MRPKNVVLLGGSGTHSVCVCTIHQNFKLMIENSKLSILPEFKSIVCEDINGKLDYTHLLSRLACIPPLPNCLLGSCSTCGKKQELREELAEAFENEDVDEITYGSWVSVDRTYLETNTKPTDEFVNNLIDETSGTIHSTGTIFFFKGNENAVGARRLTSNW